MKNRVITTLAGLFVIFGVNVASAAEAIDLSHESPGRAATLEAGSAIKETSKNIDFNQTTHTRVYQTYRGYRVYGGEAVYHTPKAGRSISKNGIFYRGLAADLASSPSYMFTPAGADKALQVAIKHYADTSQTKFSTSQTSSNLLIYIDDKQKAHWAYEVKFTTSRIHRLPAKPIYFIDAVTYEVLTHWNDLKTSSNIVNGGGIGGNGRIGKVIYDGLPNHRPSLEMTRDPSTKLCSLQNDTVIIRDSRDESIPTFRCDVPDVNHNNVYWNTLEDPANGGYSPNNDGIYSDKIVREMYLKWLNVNMLEKNGKPMKVTFYVHDQEQGQNAYYNNGIMVFGEGDDESYPVVAPSVVAHEMTHGFTEQHSDLQYRGQSGGMNEAFSDMADKAVEYYMYGSNNWEIDAELLKDGGRILRYMDEPTKDCGSRDKPGESCSINHVKDYSSEVDVHFSSGIYNKAFYLMASAWNTQQAFEVMTQANMNYWTPSATFAHAACGVIKAARDYKYDENVVRDAMKVVGVDTSKCT